MSVTTSDTSTRSRGFLGLFGAANDDRTGPSRRDLMKGAGRAFLGAAAVAPVAAVLAPSAAEAKLETAVLGPAETASDVSFVVPESFQLLGRLIETWSLDPAQVPSEQGALRRSIESAVGPLPERIKTIRVIQATMDTMTIVLPPAPMVEAGKAAVVAGERYPLPSEYTDVVMNKSTALDAEDFFYFRVGEYSLNQCK